MPCISRQTLPLSTAPPLVVPISARTSIPIHFNTPTCLHICNTPTTHLPTPIYCHTNPPWQSNFLSEANASCSYRYKLVDTCDEACYPNNRSQVSMEKYHCTDDLRPHNWETHYFTILINDLTLHLRGWNSHAWMLNQYYS